MIRYSTTKLAGSGDFTFVFDITIYNLKATFASKFVPIIHSLLQYSDLSIKK